MQPNVGTAGDRRLAQSTLRCELEFDLPLVDFRATGIHAKAVKIKHGGSRHLAGPEFTSANPDTNMKIQLFEQLLVSAAA
ncbi:MAG: hypothetical protein Q7T21_11270 [Gallionella sp.]|nr:hypothetical protein [Gallionella sp.]